MRNWGRFAARFEFTEAKGITQLFKIIDTVSKDSRLQV
jgi:hypothetical protein